MSVWTLMGCALLAQQASAQAIEIVPGFELADQRIADLDGDGRAEFIAVGRDGRVRSCQPLGAQPSEALGELQLPTPQQTLLELAVWQEQLYLIALGPGGVQAFEVGRDGVVSAEGSLWIARAKFQLRLAAPGFSPIVQDVNRDGLNDILVPTLAGIEFWQASMEQGQTRPSFRKAATVQVEVSQSADLTVERLSDTLSSSISIPGLRAQDVNGDGRPDLVIEQDQRRAWHLQRADASFPLQADVELDLSIFKDTTPKAEFQFGGTLTPDESTSFDSSDLDGDAIPDYVIGQGRKVWVFRGGTGGPQFTAPSAILKTAEDITALSVLPLDADQLADLLLIKVEIPTLAALLRGLFGEWDVTVRVLGYKNIGEGRFEERPSLNNRLALRLPGIIGLLRHPEKIAERFENLEAKLRSGARGDLDGDGVADVLLVTVGDQAIEVWLGQRAETSQASPGARQLTELLFGEDNAVFDLERVIASIGSMADRQVALATGDRAPDRTLALRPPAESRLLGLQCADFDGDGSDEIVIAYRDPDSAGASRFDVLRGSARR